MRKIKNIYLCLEKKSGKNHRKHKKGKQNNGGH